MSGRDKYILDTNAIISLLDGNTKLNDLIKNAEWIGISVISELEFLSYPQLDEADVSLFNTFKGLIEVVDIANSNIPLMRSIIEIRTKYKVKLPDAVIVAVAMNSDAILLTDDKQLLGLFRNITQALP
ncbi:MAG: PIN domain-containing protein [Bacteroidia bacterium]|nr:PIN domain-containing protein [Bacteroidia bacterium]